MNKDYGVISDSIARELGMSVSGFYHHFKAVTPMSPLQFQKRLRLQEARRLMLGKGLDASTLPYRRCMTWTGYEESQGKMSACSSLECEGWVLFFESASTCTAMIRMEEPGVHQNINGLNLPHFVFGLRSMTKPKIGSLIPSQKRELEMPGDYGPLTMDDNKKLI